MLKKYKLSIIRGTKWSAGRCSIRDGAGLCIRAVRSPAHPTGPSCRGHVDTGHASCGVSPPHCALHVGAVEGGKMMFRGALQREGSRLTNRGEKGTEGCEDFVWEGVGRRGCGGGGGEEAGRVEGLRVCCPGDFTSGGLQGWRSNRGCWSRGCQAIARGRVLGMSFCESALWWRGHLRRPASSPCYPSKLFRTGLPQMSHLRPGGSGVKYSWCKETKTRRKHYRTVNIDRRFSVSFEAREIVAPSPKIMSIISKVLRVYVFRFQTLLCTEGLNFPKFITPLLSLSVCGRSPRPSSVPRCGD